MFVVLSLKMTSNNLKSICIKNLMKIPQNFEIFPIICVGCIHEIMNQRCTLNKDLGDYLFWNIHEIYYEYFIYRLKKTSKILLTQIYVALYYYVMICFKSLLKIMSFSSPFKSI